ncbi:MAG TPA: response regulator [Terriglobales bacterium]|nr:response regulator [Terriglobales bacterium]
MQKFAAIKRSKDGLPVRYLVVDDSLISRKHLGRMIESFGGEVVAEAGDGMVAVTQYQRMKPDVVLMDITMPQMGGMEALEKIIRQDPQARIVMVSAAGYRENITTAMRGGARHFVRKPVKPEALYGAIRDALGEEGAPGREDIQSTVVR